MRPFRPGEAGYVGPGITFLHTPLILDPDELDGVDVAILGAPFDEGVTYRPGPGSDRAPFAWPITPASVDGPTWKSASIQKRS